MKDLIIGLLCVLLIGLLVLAGVIDAGLAKAAASGVFVYDSKAYRITPLNKD